MKADTALNDLWEQYPPPVLGIQVSSSEPPEVDGSGNTILDVLITEIDQAAGCVDDGQLYDSQQP